MDTRFEKFIAAFRDNSFITALKEASIYIDEFYAYIDSEGNEGKKEQYIRTRNGKAELEVSRLDDIEAAMKAKEIEPAIGRIMCDNAKWKACKFYPRMYGQQVDITSEGKALKAVAIVPSEKDAEEWAK